MPRKKNTDEISETQTVKTKLTKKTDNTAKTSDAALAISKPKMEVKKKTVNSKKNVDKKDSLNASLTNTDSISPAKASFGTAVELNEAKPVSAKANTAEASVETSKPLKVVDNKKPIKRGRPKKNLSESENKTETAVVENIEKNNILKSKSKQTTKSVKPKVLNKITEDVKIANSDKIIDQEEKTKTEKTENISVLVKEISSISIEEKPKRRGRPKKSEQIETKIANQDSKLQEEVIPVRKPASVNKESKKFNNEVDIESTNIIKTKANSSQFKSKSLDEKKNEISVPKRNIKSLSLRGKENEISDLKKEKPAIIEINNIKDTISEIETAAIADTEIVISKKEQRKRDWKEKRKERQLRMKAAKLSAANLPVQEEPADVLQSISTLIDSNSETEESIVTEIAESKKEQRKRDWKEKRKERQLRMKAAKLLAAELPAVQEELTDSKLKVVYHEEDESVAETEVIADTEVVISKKEQRKRDWKEKRKERQLRIKAAKLSVVTTEVDFEISDDIPESIENADDINSELGDVKNESRSARRNRRRREIKQAKKAELKRIQAESTDNNDDEKINVEVKLIDTNEKDISNKHPKKIERFLPKKELSKEKSEVPVIEATENKKSANNERPDRKFEQRDKRYKNTRSDKPKITPVGALLLSGMKNKENLGDDDANNEPVRPKYANDKTLESGVEVNQVSQTDKSAQTEKPAQGLKSGPTDRRLPVSQRDKSVQPGKLEQGLKPAQTDKRMSVSQRDKSVQPGKLEQGLKPAQTDKNLPVSQTDKSAQTEKPAQGLKPAQTDKNLSVSQVEKSAQVETNLRSEKSLQLEKRVQESAQTDKKIDSEKIKKIIVPKKEIKPIIPVNPDKLLKPSEKREPFIASFMMEFEKFVINELYAELNSKIIIGVSGGVDSIALLDAMAVISDKYRFQLYIAHYNHNLREDDSNEDELFVKEIAKEYNIPIYIAGGKVKQFAEKNAQSVETAARFLRYSFFERTSRTIEADYVATAHTADDSAETFMFNLMRGSGLTGLSGIPSRRVFIKDVMLIRPFINFKKDRLIEYAKKRNLKWREDKSNKTTNFTRNKIRLDLIPKIIEDYNPSVIDVLNRAAKLIHGADRIIHEYVKTNLPTVITDITTERFSVKVQLFQTFDEFIQGEMIQTALAKYFRIPPPTLNIIDKILRLLQANTGAQAEVSKNISVVRERQALVFFKKQSTSKINMTLELNQKYKIANNLIVLSEVDKKDAELNKQSNIEFFDLDRIKFPLTIRNWEAGDSFEALGLNGSIKVSDFLTNDKTAQLDKQNILVLCSQDDIIWLVGKRISEKAKITAKTKKYLRIEIRYNEK